MHYDANTLPILIIIFVLALFFSCIVSGTQKRINALRLLQASGCEVIGRIITVKKIQGRSGDGIAIKFEFQTHTGMMHKGQLRIMDQWLSTKDIFIKGSFVKILYSEKNPNFNIPTDAVAAQIASFTDYKSGVKKLLLFFVTLLFICVAVLWIFAFYQHLIH